MNNVIQVALAEDHLIMRQGIMSLLKLEQNINVLFDVSNGKELLEKVSVSKPEIILLDIDMPVMNGEETLDQLSNLYPEIKVMMLTQHFSSGHILSFLKKGARAFLPKQDSVEKIIKAINSVYDTGFYYDNEVIEIIEHAVKTQSEEDVKILKAGLTDREVAILKLLRSGKTKEEIAKEFDISDNTVKWHRKNLIHKLRCTDQVDLINWSKKNLS